MLLRIKRWLETPLRGREIIVLFVLLSVVMGIWETLIIIGVAVAVLITKKEKRIY